MIHDRQMLEAANSRLLELGAGEIAYLRPVSEAERLEMGLDEPRHAAIAWKVCSAAGEPLALCATAADAWSYAIDNGLVPVSIH